MNRSIIAQGGIAAEQNRQDVLRIAAEMWLASQVAGAAKPKENRTSYLLLAKLASLNPFRQRAVAAPGPVVRRPVSAHGSYLD